MTNSVLILSLALAAEHLAIAYYTWVLAKRKGRHWFAYAIFGLVGYVVLVLRSTNPAVLDDRPRITSRSAYTHTGFARPGDTVARPEEIQEALERRRKRIAPLAGYHMPRGMATSRAR